VLVTVILARGGKWCTGSVCNSLVKQTHKEIQQIVRDGETIRGEAVMWVGGEDWFDPNYIEQLVKAIAGGADLVYTDLMVHCQDAIRMVPLPDFSEETILAGKFALAPFAVRAKYSASLQTPPELWLNIARNGAKVVRLADVYYHQRIDSSQWVKCAETFARETQTPTMQMRKYASGVRV